MKYAFAIILLSTCCFTAQAQLSKSGYATLQKDQDSLKVLCYKMVNASMSEDREKSSNQFIPALVDALKTKYSYEFPFDSLKEVSIVYDKDSTFRIFTWAIAQSDVHYRFYGALQMKTSNGKLKLFPFFDNTLYTKNLDTITSNRNWMGALYYNIVQTQKNGEKLYTLMGWKGYGFRTNSKLLDVLTFHDGKPVFGAPVFYFKNDSTKPKIENRFILVYKRDGNASLNYNPNMKMIVFDHLTSLNKQPKDKASLVPDGTYEGFKWENGYWKHVPKIFHDTIEKPPFPNPLKFSKENVITGNKGQK